MSAKCSVRNEWFDKEDELGHKYSVWAARANRTAISCNLCDCTFSVEQKGFQALQQHVKTKKHKTAVEVKLNPRQLVLAAARPAEAAQPAAADVAATAPAPVQLALRQPGAVRAELIWAMKCIQSSYSAASNDGIVGVFREMFGDEHVPKNMTLGRTKTGYLWTEALGPYFRKLMLEDVVSAVSYTVCFDETTNEKRVKELQVGIRFYSEKRKEVVFHHLETFFIGKATADIVFGLLVRSIDSGALYLGKMLMLSSDGPNVNKSIFNKFREKIKLECDRGLLNIGFCNLHILHNGFQRGLSVMGSDVSEIAILVYDFLNYPSRFEEYEKSQDTKKVPLHAFLKHVTSRWLTLGPAAERLQEQWPALADYFLKVLPLKKGKDAEKLLQSKCYQAIASALRDDTFPARIAFVVYSASLFERFSKVFQSQQPMIHVLYEEVSNLFILLLSRFCKSEVLKSTSECLKESFIMDNKNFVEVKNVDIGRSAERLLTDKRCRELDVLKFHQEARMHYQEAAKHVLHKSILSTGKDAKHLKRLQPQAIKESRSVRSIVLVYKMLQLPLADVDEDKLRDEWKLLQLENLPRHEDGQRIDHFWNQIFGIKDFTGQAKYPLVSTVVKAVLPAAHGSADVERGFSESRNQLPADRSAMEERTLNARLNIRDGMREFGGRAEAVPITHALLKAAAGAHSKYEDYLEAKRKESQEEQRRKEEAESIRRKAEEEEAAQVKERRDIGKLQEDLRKAKEAEEAERQASDKLIDEANQKLKNALEKGDLKTAKIAQGMLEGARSMRSRAEDLHKKQAEPLRKKVEKRTSTLLGRLFKNHEKRRRDGNGDDPDDPV